MSDSLRALRGIADRARREGARAAEVLAEQWAGFGGEVRRGKVIRRTELGGDELTVRVWLDDGREGSATGVPSVADSLVMRALARANDGSASVFSGPVARMSASSGLGIDDRRYASITAADRVDVILGAERAGRSVDRRVTTLPFVYADERRWRGLVNTNEVELEEWSTLFEARGGVVVGDEGRSVELSGGIEGRSFSSIASLPFGVDLARRALSLLEHDDAASGPYRVLMPPRVVAELFAAVADLFAAESTSPGSTFLAAGREVVLDRRLHFLDDGLLPGGLRTRSFDDRGVPPVPVMLLREGRVDGTLRGPAVARAADHRPTGHIVGTVLRPSNLQLRSGTRSMNALLAEMDRPVLIIDHLEDLPAALDPKTGRLDGRCWGSVRDGAEIVATARSRRLEGDLLAALAEIVDLASDTDRIGHVDAPGLLLDGLELLD